jgi:hypothetical protein
MEGKMMKMEPEKGSLVTLRIPPLFTHDKEEDGWKLIKNAKLREGSTLALVKVLLPDEARVTGSDLLRRVATFRKHAGQLHAEQLLKDISGRGTLEDIPKGWGTTRRYPGLRLFLGTEWRNSDGLRYPCLSRSGQGWNLCFAQFDNILFFENDRLVIIL